MKRSLHTIALLSLSLLASLTTAGDKINVVTSFSVLADISKEIGGEHIALTNLVGANGDAHVYQPSPIDTRAVAQADVLIINGIGFEGWMQKLQQASGFKGQLVVASEGSALLEVREGAKHHDSSDEHQAGEYDPHAWHSLNNAQQYVANITAALIKADPTHREDYLSNSARYQQEIADLKAELTAQAAKIPLDKRTVITSHDAFAYLGHSFSFHFIAPVGLSTEAEASAADVANIIAQIKQFNIKAIFVENTLDPRLIGQIARESDTTVAGKLYADALSTPEEGAASYLQMMAHNVRSLITKLAQ